MRRTDETGASGEQAAVDYLRKEGFRIVQRNWRTGRYELDIVAVREDRIHFIEVKTRRVEGLTTPDEAMTPAKMRALRRAVESYLALYDTDLEPQIDFVAVDLYPDGEYGVRYVPEAVISRW